MKTLKDLFLAEVTGMYDSERQIVKALPKLAQAATCANLKAALQAHLTETEGHVTKLEQVLQAFEQKPQTKTCQVTTDLLAHGDRIVTDYKGSTAMDAGLISAAQKVEHLEIAAYGALHAWAIQLGNPKAASLIEAILGEEKAANETLTKLALANCNKEAMGECGHSAKETSELIAPLPKAGTAPATSGRKPAPVLK